MKWKWFIFVYRSPGNLPDDQFMQIHACDFVSGADTNRSIPVTLDQTPNWIRVTPTSGNTPLQARAHLTNEAKKLALGIHSAHIQVSSSSPLVRNSPQIVNVTLQVVAR